MTQADIVIEHFKKRGALTQVDANGLYGISRLAAVVYKLRRRGVKVVSRMKQGVRAQYAEYSLSAAR